MEFCLKNCSTFSCHCTRVCLSFKASAPFLSLFLPLLPKPILSKTLISPMLFRISTFEKHSNFPFSSFRFGILVFELIVALFDEFLTLIGWYCLRLANQQKFAFWVRGYKSSAVVGVFFQKPKRGLSFQNKTFSANSFSSLHNYGKYY